MQAIGRQPQRAPDGAPVHDERHRPEQTTLDRLVQQHAATFFAQAEDAAGADLPPFFKDEFEAFLECGILAHGFLRLRCGSCGHDKLVALSWKRRGFCPSCGARRVAQTAAELIDHVNAGNLHDQPPELFGRGDELQELQGLIDSHAVVTVTGAGGIGKTGLAQGAVTTACAAASRLVGLSSRRCPTRRRWRARLRCRCAGAAG